MKLEEQMLNVTDGLNKYPMCFDTANQCAKIAEDFAIGFGKWMITNAEKYNEYLYKIQDLNELLEMYKLTIK